MSQLNSIEGSETELLEKFFETIWGTTEGFIYLAFKSASTVQVSWRQEFFKWPTEKERVINKVLDQNGRADVYFGPSIFKLKNSTKDSFYSSRVLWVDFDGNAPPVVEAFPAPTIKIQSSIDGHEHWYWKLDKSIEDSQVLETLNRNLAYSLGADLSGWDCNQVLRPPLTYNHKRKARTTFKEFSHSILSINSFNFKGEAPKPVEEPAIVDLPPVVEVIDRYKFPAKVWILFKQGVKEGSRSEGLMALGYGFAEIGMSNEEILSCLLDADNRWGKFRTRTDQLRMLTKIVAVARVKYPLNGESLNQKRLQVMGFKTLLLSPSIELKWVWEGFLQEHGYLLLTGAPKVGKTQFSLDFGARAVLGENFLDRPCRKDLKIGFLSLEMGAEEVKLFLQNQASGLTEEQLQELEERFLMIPVGEPLYLSREREQDELEEMVHEYQLDGLIIDSLGSTVEGELTSEKDAKAVMDWNDRVRRRHSCFTWYIHHHRKATGDNKKPSKLADIYGSYLFTARVTTALTLWNSNSNSITLIPNAVRLAETPEPFQVYRDNNLRFTTKKSGITIIKKGKEVEQLDVPDNEAFKVGKFEY